MLQITPPQSELIDNQLIKLNNASAVKNRDKSMDALKLFAIFLVLWGHAVQQFTCGGGAGSGNMVFRAIYAFHMPLFMGIVGYFGASLSKLSFKDFITKKFRQLILPALSFGILYSLVIKLGIGEGRWLSGWTWFWFLKSAFVCCGLYWLGTRWKKHLLAGIALSILLSFCYAEIVYEIPTITGIHIIGEWHVPKMYLCFVGGAMLKLFSDKIRGNELKVLLWSGLIWVSMWIVIVSDMAFYQFSMTRSLLLSGTAWFNLIEGLAAIVFFITLFQYVGKRVSNMAYGDRICSWGSMTLSIYCLQVFIMETFLPRLLDFRGINHCFFDIVVAPFISLVVLLICIGITKMIQRSSFLSWLLLGKELWKYKVDGALQI